MIDDRFAKLKAILAEAVELSAERRAEFVAEACAGDPDLRSEVEEHLAYAEGDPSILKTGAIGELTPVRPVDPNETLVADLPESARGELTGRKIGHYTVQKRLGAGGMGEVYLAHDDALDRPVALKVLPEGFSPAVRERLLREAWASARVQHPGIATFYEAGHADGMDFIAMEFVPGRTLREHAGDRALPFAEAIDVIASLLEALVHAHFSGILHRDIKPENVMIADDGGAKLLDFGLAKGALMAGDLGEDSPAPEAGGSPEVDTAPDATLVEETRISEVDVTRPGLDADTPEEAIALSGARMLTRAGAILGTPGYMPPEQLRGEVVDARADVFAAGAVLYEMLAGRPAFPGDTIAERFEAILERDPAPIVRDDVPPEVVALVHRTLARHAAERPESAAAFLAELRRIVGPDKGSRRTVRLAVTEFRNGTGREDLDWIGSAVPEDLRSRLARARALTVLPRASVLEACGEEGPPSDPASDVTLGLRLACTTVVTGAYELEGAELRLSARLTDVATGYVFLEEAWTGTPQEMLDLQHRFADAIAASLECEIPREERPARDVEAYSLYSRAVRIVWSADRTYFDEARELLERAVELDPQFARALACLAQLHAWASHSDVDPEQLAKAEAYVERAVKADPESTEVHYWRSYVMYLHGRMVEAVRESIRMLELDSSQFLPRHFITTVLSFGRTREEALQMVEVLGGRAGLRDPHRWLREKAVRLGQESVHLAPRYRWAWFSLGWVQLGLGRLAEARWCLEKAVELEPVTVPPTGGIAGFLGECLRRGGDLDASRRVLLEALDAVERTDYMYRDTWRGFFLCGLGRTALEQGDRAAAATAFRQATLHARGRANARAAGRILVQALAGEARAGAGPEPFETALRLFEEREGFDFQPLWGCSDDFDLFELARAARALDRVEEAEELLTRARQCGATEPW